MKFYIIAIFTLTYLSATEPVNKKRGVDTNFITLKHLSRIGDYGYPNDPQHDRAKGYLLKGKAKTVVSNYGNYIDWKYHPSGFWGEYGYIVDLGFMTGIPGHSYSSQWSQPGYESWIQSDTTIGSGTFLYWYSVDAYNAWVDDVADPVSDDGNFKTIIYNTIDDRGDIAEEIESFLEIDLQMEAQWFLDHDIGRIYLYMKDETLNPNFASSRIGLAYPWSIRPNFIERQESFDFYDYGEDQEEWTNDDDYVYYGANTAESWFIRDGGWNPSKRTDWQATTQARYNTHHIADSGYTAGDIFGNTIFTDSYDYDALLAHSGYPATWPTKYSFDTGSYVPFWPGWWADEYYGESPDSWSSVGIYDCNGTRADAGCWKPLPGRHISDMDVYMEFDDRWANVGNEVVDNEYVSAGYPMGLKVRSMAHSYGVAYAEDVMFVTIKVRNESGDYCAFEKDKNQIKIPVKDENGFVVCEDGMIMPDGTKLNRGKGFNYKKVSMGFYVDPDVLSVDMNGNFSVHTNEDDFISYIDCRISSDIFPNGCPDYQGDVLRISLAVVGDYDGISNSTEGYSMNSGEQIGTDFGVVAIQLLDTPYASDPIDLDQDGFIDIYPGEKLKMTDWHWFDWYNRPGVLAPGTSNNPALNKELIQYQVMAGDNTNLTLSEKPRYFHTANPQTDLDSELNPHFDSLEGLEETSYFQNGPNGIDGLFIMSSGPFDLEVGEQIKISFGLIFGETLIDLVDNAEIAQAIYNGNYAAPKHPTAPISPEFTATIGDYSINLNWNNGAENSIDSLTGENDFQGYKIYRSIDNGVTWGDSVFNYVGEHVGWNPINQFDLVDNISGLDSLAPWINLGNNTGIQYSMTDSNLYAYREYCYSVTAYDSGLEPGGVLIENDLFNFEDGYIPLESNIGVNMLCLSPRIQNIYTPSPELLFQKNESNIGWSDISYIPHNVDTVNPGIYKFEIQSEIDSNTFQYNKIKNPRLFIYEVNSIGNIIDSLIGGFPIYSIDEHEAEDNWLDVLGMYINWKNYLSQPVAVYTAELDTVYWQTGPIYSNDDLLSINLEYSTNPNIFLKRPYFDYLIEFGELGLDTATHVSPSSGCSGTLFPFRISNKTTGKKVMLRHLDKGIFGISGVQGDIGYNDCKYTQSEKLKFYETEIDINDMPDDYNTYNLSFNWSVESVEENTMYPWSLNDSLLIITRKMVHNGDSWFVDLSLITNPDTGLAIPKKGLIPARFNLNAPYPNPFNPITRIAFSVPITNDISIIIYDLLGRQVEVLHNEITTPGVYSIFWDGSPFSSGVYLLRMESSSSTASSDQRFTQTRKVVLLK